MHASYKVRSINRIEGKEAEAREKERKNEREGDRDSESQKSIRRRLMKRRPFSLCNYYDNSGHKDLLNICLSLTPSSCIVVDLLRQMYVTLPGINNNHG